jgi:hypothetical protein
MTREITKLDDGKVDMNADHCPFCGSRQLRYRKTFQDYACNRCGQFSISHLMLRENPRDYALPEDARTGHKP